MAISIANNSCSPTRLGAFLDEKAGPPPKQSMWHRLGLRRWLSPSSAGEEHDNNNNNNHRRAPSAHNLTRRLSRKVGVGLPRSTTSKRQNSEHHDRLAPLEPQLRRALSVDRRPLSAQRTRSPQPAVGQNRLSAPEVQWFDLAPATMVDEALGTNDGREVSAEWDPYPDVTADAPVAPPDTLEMELEQRWILNLSMHFRDRSEREKFFVTYAETPNRWRRVTISLDYRGATPDSLEEDLKELRYQRDKCARIYESVRESLSEIQFYDTVTNLKLETRDDRLHVHVTEDVNEIIPYPPISSIGHLHSARYVPEHHLHFDSHLSGFVYKVRMGGHAYIKKEISGPDTVDEFLYEINALHALSDSPSVAQVEGIVVDERQEVVKGLLISYAEQGALVDILYEQRGAIAFARRERWAKQIIQGLCEIHESGYVQGDFTLSNIVVDGDNNAKIIDINRRGCPVGWEPPEIGAKIESNQRISMYIGVKTDLYQLGMTLWALAMEEDEPERQPRPLMLGDDVQVPDYYRRLVDICLSPTPRHRLAAKELLALIPDTLPDFSSSRLLGPCDDRPLLPSKSNLIGYPPSEIRPLPTGGVPPPPLYQHAAQHTSMAEDANTEPNGADGYELSHSTNNEPYSQLSEQRRDRDIVGNGYSDHQPRAQNPLPEQPALEALPIDAPSSERALQPKEKSTDMGPWKNGHSYSTPSLLHSTLPINPASSLPKHQPPAPDTKRVLSRDYTHSSLEDSEPLVRSHTWSLSESQLPINPGFTESS